MERTGSARRNRRHVLVALPWLAAIVLTACTGGSPTPPVAANAASAPPVETVAPAQQSVAAPASNAAPSLPVLLRVIGGECSDTAHANGCTAGDYDLDLTPGCGADGYFAGVADAVGAVLLDAAPPNDTVKRASLAHGQIVCIQATANAGGSPAWYYVTAVPVANIPACAGNNRLCQMYGDRPVTWLVDTPIPDCATLGVPQVDGKCVSGWTRADALDVFSNGM